LPPAFTRASNTDFGYFVAMGEPGRKHNVARSAETYAIDDPEHAIPVGASTGIQILSPSETQPELPQQPSFDVTVR
jgi:hypothetical protein